MTRQEALNTLDSSDLHIRLEAARVLAQTARPGDVARVQAALATENVMWVKTALRQAVDRASVTSAVPTLSARDIGEIVPTDVFNQIRTIAVGETTRRIVHEIAPILGILGVYSKEEIRNFDQSKTKRQIDRLHQLLHALDRLSQSASAPVLAEFDIAAAIQSVSAAECDGRKVSVRFAGLTPLVVVGDKGLFELAFVNGLRNAIEVVEEIHTDNADPPPVVVTWGITDIDVWVAILDRGTGPPVTVDRAFEIGSTTKKHHLGMGLATARQALLSLSGTASLKLRGDEGGAEFEIRWPKLGIG